MNVGDLAFFFSTRFLTAECLVARTVLLVSLQALGTMLAIYMPAAPGCAEERAKSKPVSLGEGFEVMVVICDAASHRCTNWRHCAHDTAFWMNQLDNLISFTEI